MGVFIYLDVSKSVTREEWKHVYEESLLLVEKFPLCEIMEKECMGEKLRCSVKTKERIFKSRYWSDWVGWRAQGDLDTLSIAEDFILRRDLVEKDEPGEHIDALIEILDGELSLEKDDPRRRKCYGVWGSKTQREPIHIYILAIGCLIVTRLGEKAAVYGDIYEWEVEEAVRLANTYLKVPVEKPVQFEMVKFKERLRNMPLSPEEEAEAFVKCYQGEKGAKFKDFVRENFVKEFAEKYLLEADVPLYHRRKQRYYFKDVLCQKEEKSSAEKTLYDINEMEELMRYKPGNSIEPCLKDAVGKSFVFYSSISKEPRCMGLKGLPYKFRCQYLIGASNYVMLLEEEWQKIFEDMKENEEAIERYYPMTRVKASGTLTYLRRAFVANDAFYEYCKMEFLKDD